jgi:hypothetical protein
MRIVKQAYNNWQFFYVLQQETISAFAQSQSFSTSECTTSPVFPPSILLFTDNEVFSTSNQSLLTFSAWKTLSVPLTGKSKLLPRAGQPS